MKMTHTKEPKILTAAMRERIAKHEAGHALVAMLLGKNVDYIEILAEGVALTNQNGIIGCVHFVEEKNAVDTYADLIISTAGLAGERIANKRPGEFSPENGRNDDLKDALHSVPFNCGDFEEPGFEEIIDPDFQYTYIQKSLNHGLMIAWSILRDHADAFEEFADFLLRHGRLNRLDALAILRKTITPHAANNILAENLGLA